MADIALGIVVRIIKVAFKLNEAVGTVQQNEEECRALEEEMAILIASLSPLQVMGAVNPTMTRALMGLEKTIDSALELVTNCQEKHTFVHRLFTASDMAKKLARVKDDIHRKVDMCILGLLAIRVECYCYTVTVPFSSAHLPPLAQLHQDAGKLDMPYNSHARSGVNSMTTMSVTGSEVPYGPLSGTTELTFSKLEATTQNISGENVAEGGGQTRVYTMQRIVIKFNITKFDMTCSNYRIVAMALVATINGVSSFRTTGDGRDMLEVVGSGLDPVYLIGCLRRKVGYAELLQVEGIERPEPVVTEEARPVVTDEARPADDKPANRRRRARSGGIRAICTKLSKFIWSRTRTSISRPPLSPTASRGPRSNLLSDVSPPQLSEQPRRPPGAVDPLLPPVMTAPARRRRRTFNMSRVRLSAPRLAATRCLPTTPEPGVPRDGPVRALQECVAMFDGPLPLAVIAALTVALFLVVTLCLHQL